MKNSLKLVQHCAAVSLLLIFTNCRHKEDDSIVVIDKKEVDSVIIPLEQAEEMYNTYTDRRVELIKNFENSLDSLNNYDPESKTDNQKYKAAIQQKENGFVPTRYISYDYQALKKYMAFIEQESKKANVNISTLRFYLANYSDKSTDAEKKRRNTIMMVPSLQKNGKEYAFFTANDDKDNMKRKAFLLTEELTEDGTSYSEDKRDKASLGTNFTSLIMAPFAAQSQQSLVGNEGGLHPPKN